MSSNRLACLDGLRAVAVAVVLLSHLARTSGAPSALAPLTRAMPGDLGVQIFFVISGFIITFLLLREHASTGAIALRKFWARRALRILPPVIALLFVLQLLTSYNWLSVSPPSQWASLFFVRNHVGDGWFNGHMWSLSVEEQFYLLWPLAMPLLLARARAPNFLYLVLLAPLVRLFCILLGRPDWAAYSLLANCDGLFFGAWAAWYRAGKSSFPQVLLNQVERYLPMIPLIIVGLSWFKVTRFAIFPVTVTPLLLSATIAVLLIRLTDSDAQQRYPRLYRWLNSTPMVRIGVMSYSLYLWQQLFLCPSGAWLRDPGIWVQFPFNLGAALVVGWLSYRCIELPCARLRARFS